MRSAVHSRNPGWFHDHLGISLDAAINLKAWHAFGSYLFSRDIFFLNPLCDFLGSNFTGSDYDIDSYNFYEDAFFAYIAIRRPVNTQCTTKQGPSLSCGQRSRNSKFFFDPNRQQFRLLLKHCSCGCYMYPLDQTPYILRGQVHKIFSTMWEQRHTFTNDLISKLKYLIFSNQSYVQVKQKDE